MQLGPNFVAGMAAGPQAGGLALASRHHGGHAGNQSFGTGSSTVVIKARVPFGCETSEIEQPNHNTSAQLSPCLGAAVP